MQSKHALMPPAPELQPDAADASIAAMDSLDLACYEQAMAPRRTAADLLEQYLTGLIDTAQLRSSWPEDDPDVEAGCAAVFANFVGLLPAGKIVEIPDQEVADRVRDLGRRCMLFLRTDQPCLGSRVVRESVLAPIVIAIGILVVGFVLTFSFLIRWVANAVVLQVIFWGFFLAVGYAVTGLSQRRLGRIRRRRMLGPDRLTRWPFPEDPKS